MRGWRGPSGRSRPHASVAAAFGQVPEHPAYLGVGGDAGLGISASSARTSPLSTGLCPRDLTDAAFSVLTEPSRRPPRPVSPPAGSRRRHRLPASGRTRRARTRLRAGRPRCAPGSPYVPPRASRPRRVSARIHLPRTGRPPGPPRRPSRRASSACLPRWRRRAHHREARSGSPRRRLSRRRRRSPRPAHGPTIRHQPSPDRPPAVRQRATGVSGSVIAVVGIRVASRTLVSGPPLVLRFGAVRVSGVPRSSAARDHDASAGHQESHEAGLVAEALGLEL